MDFGKPKKCKPACLSYTFYPKTIQYVRTSEKRTDLIRKVLGLTQECLKKSEKYLFFCCFLIFFKTEKEIEITSMVIRLAEDPSYVIEEKVAYAFAEFRADVGGSLGLILGLNLFSIIKFITKTTTEQGKKYRKTISEKCTPKTSRRTSQVVQ